MIHGDLIDFGEGGDSFSFRRHVFGTHPPLVFFREFHDHRFIFFIGLQKRKIFNNIAAKAGIAANVGATATALAKLKSPAGAPSAGSVGTEAAPPATESAPSFNIVGASGRNQLAEAINALQQTPMKTYVVSSDVTTAQQLDRSIIQGASI